MSVISALGFEKDLEKYAHFCSYMQYFGRFTQLKSMTVVFLPSAQPWHAVSSFLWPLYRPVVAINWVIVHAKE